MSPTQLNDQIKLLISARDPATALSFQLLIPSLLQNPAFSVKLLMQEPAYSIIHEALAQSGASHVSLESFTPRNNLQEKIKAVSTVVADFSPDAVLTGISGPDIGVDEALLKVAEQLNIPSYALQNFWGDINQATGALPHTAFVLDDEAAHLTAKRYPSIRSIPIGSIKHQNFKEFDSLALRAEQRKAWLNSSEDGAVLVGFYGQPILEVKGYFATIESMVEQLKAWQKPFKLIYRPHPKESDELQSKTWQLFSAAFADRVQRDDSDHLVKSLAACDLVVSAFSTCGFDNLYLNEMAPHGFNSSIYLWFNADLIKWWQDYSGLTEMPLKTEDLLLMVDKEEKLLEVFEQGLDQDIQQRLRQNAKLHLPDPSVSVHKVIQTIIEDWQNWHEPRLSSSQLSKY
ncbi:hypothetical protein [Thiomicrorhabdus sediminis]|uniref:CDP-Glycerol:Poly(Glycerophosphate) glycerophosphotransferase n=1 Tax=Thiomicrorhabdus sediminis TaxID=2580412 RepID=A0A4P9K7N6_9GAMM|nr:hypothetical protein [Thiomicrorhabdus sediminis]QCU90470.1 hypothetical protein FE785_07410 [Thiomicrorhabdus sediminis]